MSRTTRKLLVESWIQSEQHFINREIASHNAYLYAINGSVSSYWSRRAWRKDGFDPVASAKNSIARWKRDGRGGMTCTTVNRGFKNDAKNTLRRNNKSFCYAVLSGADYDDIALPNRKDGSSHKWDWW